VWRNIRVSEQILCGAWSSEEFDKFSGPDDPNILVSFEIDEICVPCNDILSAAFDGSDDYFVIIGVARNNSQIQLPGNEHAMAPKKVD
jgi:hypothetical protein